MPKDVSDRRARIDQFFAGPGARADRWRDLVQRAETWSKGSGQRPALDAALADIGATEAFHAYPGPVLMSALQEHAAAGDAKAVAALARRFTRALLTRSYRQNAGDWDVHEEG